MPLPMLRIVEVSRTVDLVYSILAFVQSMNRIIAEKATLLGAVLTPNFRQAIQVQIQ